MDDNPISHAEWPDLEYSQWRDTCQTLQRWTQIIGKIQLSKTPWINHSWGSALIVTEKGLATSTIHDQPCSFAIELNFISHELLVTTSSGKRTVLPLISESVSDFYKKCFRSLSDLGIQAKIYDRPNELPDDLSFPEDQLHHSYNHDAAHKFWRILFQCDRVMKLFRSRFSGKVSPVHFFWGSFDMAVTRFSGRRAPEHPGGVPHLPDLVTRESYSDEVSSCGYWPGNEQYPRAGFYSYAYPKPEGFESAKVPQGAFFDEKLREFILPYNQVRGARSPDQLLMEFFQSTYEAAAVLGKWDRAKLEGSEYLKLIQKRQKARLSRKAA